MKLVSKTTFMRHENHQTPMTSFVLYVSAKQPRLLMRIYQSIGNDVWDEHFDILSNDNGRTWSPPRVVMKREPVEGGEMSYTEGAALYCPDRDMLVTVTDYGFEPERTSYNPDTTYGLHIATGKPGSMEKAIATVTNLGFRQGVGMSFCHPFVDSTGRLVFPGMNAVVDSPVLGLARKGYRVRKDMPDVMADYAEPRLVIGEFKTDGCLSWHVTQAVPFAPDVSARGLCEPTVLELNDGRFAMICRGSNGVWVEGQGTVVKVPHPGCKWVSYSRDRGETWSEAKPLTDESGTLLESSATGSWLFRSTANRKVYWIGNLCVEGQKPLGNWPRDNLMIAEVSEGSTLALKRETLAIIAKAESGESDQLQHSNFRAYQDRENGEIVLYVNRFFERGGWENLGWHNTDLYCYRYAL